APATPDNKSYDLERWRQHPPTRSRRRCLEHQTEAERRRRRHSTPAINIIARSELPALLSWPLPSIEQRPWSPAWVMSGAWAISSPPPPPVAMSSVPLVAMPARVAMAALGEAHPRYVSDRGGVGALAVCHFCCCRCRSLSASSAAWCRAAPTPWRHR